MVQKSVISQEEIEFQEGKVIVVGIYAEDIERMIEELTTKRRNFIVDKTSFEVAFDSEFFEARTAKQKSFRNEVFLAYRLRHPNVPNKRIFKRRVEVTESSTKLVIRKEGKLSQTDLDKFKSIPQTNRIQKSKLIHAAIRKGQVVFAERIFVTVLGKKQTRFRDKTGKFCSKKK